jgi:hypothetical protein
MIVAAARRRLEDDPVEEFVAGNADETQVRHPVILRDAESVKAVALGQAQLVPVVHHDGWIEHGVRVRMNWRAGRNLGIQMLGQGRSQAIDDLLLPSAGSRHVDKYALQEFGPGCQHAGCSHPVDLGHREASKWQSWPWRLHDATIRRPRRRCHRRESATLAVT